MSDTTTHTNNSVPERIYDTSRLRHDVLQKIFPTSWASEYPGKPRLSRRERRNREQRRIIARTVAEVFDADTDRRRRDQLAKVWGMAIGEIFSDGVKRPPADLWKVREFNTRHQQARLKIEDLNAKVAQISVDAADLRLQFIRLGLKSNDGKRKGIDERGVTFGTARTDNLDDPSLQVVDDGKNLFGRVDTENLFDHSSSPSVDDAGAHSVGDGQVAGVGTPASVIGGHDLSAFNDTVRGQAKSPKPYTPFDKGGHFGSEVTLESLVAAVRDANLDIKSLRRVDDAARANYNESGRNLAKAIKDRSDSERALLDYLTGDQA